MNTNYLMLLFFFFAKTSFYGQDLEDLSYTKLSSVDLYCSKGFETDGLFIGQLTDEANAFYEASFMRSISPTKVLFLSKPVWSLYTHYGLIYGMPHYSPKGEAMMLCAEDNEFWKSLVPEVSQLKTPYSELFPMIYSLNGSVSGRYFFDLLALHELSHQWQLQGGLFSQRLWLDEVFCNIMLHTFIAEQRGELLGALTLLPRYHVRANEVSYDYTTLEEFESNYRKLGMEAPNNYGWYQFRFHVAADELYEAGGVEVMVNLWKFLSRNKTRLSDEELIKGLEEEVHPYFGDLIANW